ncbi:ribonuclease P protein component [Candidatus Gracilibacteria bacterium]|nr:ribonuclease P protein component [Candidatus Gracilibacteria bacterium]
MLAKKNRFTQNSFEFWRKRMKGFRSGDFLFLFAPSNKETCCAVVISKKIEKLATKRNRFRRQVYEIFREYLLGKTRACNIICLYKGEKIPQNVDEIFPHIKAFIRFFVRKSQYNKK